MNNESTTGECKRNKMQHEKSITQIKAGQKKCNMQRLQLNEQHEKSAAQKNWSSAIWKSCNMNATQKMKHNKILQEKLQGKSTWK